jgi:short-subunit dehydrogenase
MNMNTTKKENKMTVLITGAAGGLGKAFAVECASRGWDLFLNDLQRDSLETLAVGLRRAYGVQVVTHACDLTDPAARAGLFEYACAEGWHFTMLVNVAGVDFEGPFFDQSAKQIQTIVRLNVEGTLAMTHAILDYRKQNETLHIINVASLAAFYPMPVKATYAASKRFLLDFSLALREEVRGLDATVTVLCPAGMPTNAECIDAIEAQGLAGQLTTRDVGRVANQTLNAAMAGKAVVIPGAINRAVRSLGGMIPAPLVAGLINWRWSSVRQKRELMEAKG